MVYSFIGKSLCNCCASDLPLAGFDEPDPKSSEGKEGTCIDFRSQALVSFTKVSRLKIRTVWPNWNVWWRAVRKKCYQGLNTSAKVAYDGIVWIYRSAWKQVDWKWFLQTLQLRSIFEVAASGSGRQQFCTDTLIYTKFHTCLFFLHSNIWPILKNSFKHS